MLDSIFIKSARTPVTSVVFAVILTKEAFVRMTCEDGSRRSLYLLIIPAQQALFTRFVLIRI